MDRFKKWQLVIIGLLYLEHTECGNICLSCSEVERITACTHLSTCDNDEVCYMHKYLTESKFEKYDLGCTYPELCSHHNSEQLFGRSLGEGHHIVCQVCCNNTNVCNMNTPCEISSVHNASAAQNLPRECDEIQSTESGVYTIYPDGIKPVSVFCIMANNEKWTVIQRRVNGLFDFYRSWAEYKAGFGSVDGEYWLGNDNIHLISASTGHQLAIYMEDFEAAFKYANYSAFLIGDENRKYQLTVSGFTASKDVGDSLSYHSGFPFSTKDKDNLGLNCPVTRHGAWWYGSCCQSNLNGPYLAGPGTNETTLLWYHWRGYYSLKKTTMMIRRTSLFLKEDNVLTNKETLLQIVCVM